MANKYKAIARLTVELEIEVIADDEESAMQMAKEIDGGDFKEIEGSEDWRIDRVNLIELNVKEEEE